MRLTSYTQHPRLVNHFKIGADPEFILVNAAGSYIHAETLGLNTTRAFGCDMAGRQAELRTIPSRSALEVTASLAEALQWMGAFHKDEVMNLHWMATAFNGKDGCGGHIHFGRRRPTRDTEIRIMDNLTSRLMAEGVLLKNYFLARRQGTKYGKWGDFRAQVYGYEYRTTPTYLASPWLTFYVLTVAKLAVHDGKLFAGIGAASLPDSATLLERYKDKDQDAAIAFETVKRIGKPKEDMTDFKYRWGVWSGNVGICSDSSHYFIPSALAPSFETCRGLFNHFVHGMPFVSYKAPSVTWAPYTLPKDVSLVHIQPHSLGHLPDVGAELLSYRFSFGVEMTPSVATPTLYHSYPLDRNALVKAFAAEGFRLSLFPVSNNLGVATLHVPSYINTCLKSCKTFNKLLANSSLLPLCRASEFHTTDWTKWDKVEVFKKNEVQAPSKLGRVVKLIMGEQGVEQVGKKEVAKEVGPRDIFNLPEEHVVDNVRYDPVPPYPGRPARAGIPDYVNPVQRRKKRVIRRDDGF